MLRSKHGESGRTTIPEPLRCALGRGCGDELDHVLEGDRAILRRSAPAEPELATDFDPEREFFADPARDGC